MAPGQEKGGLFRKKSTPPMPIRGEKPPRVSVEARLPNPPILACNEPVPLRLIVTKQSPSSEIVFLQLLQIELISYTQIRAHEFARTVPLSTLILSRSNMNAPLGRGSDPIGTEWKIDANLWNRLPLPPNVAPTFQTCNLSRHYELEVRVGLAHGRTGAIMVRSLGRGLFSQIDLTEQLASSHCPSFEIGCEGLFGNCSTTSAPSSYGFRVKG
jgi:hypothetical protein